MSIHGSLAARLCGLACWLIILPQAARSELANFVIDSSSKVRVVPSTYSGFQIVAGTRFRNVFGIYEQEAGSLEAKITGTLSADVTGSTITFGGSNLIDVLPHPAAPFLPHVAGSPGVEDNFAALISSAITAPLGEIALRDAGVSLVAGAATVGGLGTDLQFTITSGILDYRTDEPDEGFVELASVSPTVNNQATGQVSGNVDETIRIPFFLDFPYAIPVGGSINSRLVMDGELVLNRIAASLTGDYNGNQVVDAADYVVWRDTLNSSTDLRADGDNSGSIGPGDYTVWRTNFGRTPGLGTGGDSTFAVPEPSGLILVMLGVVAFVARRKR